MAFKSPGSIFINRLLPQRATRIPLKPPAAASSKLSVSNWRTMRQRLAPIARRMANSRWRAAPRAISRLATLTQAISSTNMATARSASHVGR